MLYTSVVLNDTWTWSVCFRRPHVSVLSATKSSSRSAAHEPHSSSGLLPDLAPCFSQRVYKPFPLFLLDVVSFTRNWNDYSLWLRAPHFSKPVLQNPLYILPFLLSCFFPLTSDTDPFSSEWRKPPFIINSCTFISDAVCVCSLRTGYMSLHMELCL